MTRLLSDIASRYRVSVMAALLAVAGIALGGVVLITGGFQIGAGALHLAVRSPGGALAAAVVAALVAWYASPHTGRRRDIVDWLSDPARFAPPLATALAGVVIAVGLLGTSWIAGSADASGYVAEARLLAAGRLGYEEPLARLPAIPDAFLVSPLGFRPSPGERSMLVPTYPPGLPLLMVPFVWLNAGAGPFLVVPLAGGLGIWLMAAIGRQLGYPGAGLAAALLAASFAPFLLQLLQPMSDVPVTAAWLWSTYAAIRGSAASAGAAAGVAVLIRPNLVFTSIPMALCATLGSNHTLPTRRPIVLRWLAGFAPPIAVLLALHIVWYGAPWRSGYGTASELFSVDNVAPNISVYTSWLLDVGGLLALPIALALLPPVASKIGRPAIAIQSAAAVTIAAYLPYAVFDQWTYLRFLLPGLALLMILGAVAVARIVSRPGGGLTALAVAAVLTVGQSAWQLRQSVEHQAFRARVNDQRYTLAADWIRHATPSNAVFVSAQQSGSLALHASRSVLRWDHAAPGSLDTLSADLAAVGRPVWMVLEVWEQPAFQARHGHTALGSLDWPPAADVHAAVPVRIYRLTDRAAFRAGQPVITEYVAAPRDRR